MNRLQKKCIIATAGFHLLLLVILLVGPAFFNARQKPDDSQVLDVIPANLIDAQFNSGVKNAQPPAPTPIAVQAQPQPTLPAPRPVVPQPTLLTKLEKIFTPEPVKPVPDLTPVEKPEKSQPHKIQVNTQLTTRTAPKNSVADSQRAQAIKNAVQNLKKNFSPSTTIDMPGESSAAYASYKDALATIYYNAWITPEETANDEANTMVKITVASDGTVINAQIITPSGDARTDDSIQRALERVASVPPLPDKSKTQQDFVISFNLKTKRMLE
jgi:TonB family protein